MAIPALISNSHIIVALVTEFSLVCMAIHAGAIQAHSILLLIARIIGPHSVTDNREFPVFQECFMIDPNKGFRLNTLFFILIRGKFRFGNITRLSAHRVVPDRIGDQPKKNDQP